MAYTISWDESGDRLYETGTSQGVLYVMNDNGVYGDGVAWNGLTAVTESPSGAEETALWADDGKYLSLRSREEFGGTIEAYTYPDEFANCDGSIAIAKGVYMGQQRRKTFGFCYKTVVGNDTMGEEYGYKIHLVYGATASPSEKSYATINDSPEAITFSWTFTTVPIDIDSAGEYRPTACLTIDSTEVGTAGMQNLMNYIYGNGTDPAKLPLPGEIPAIISGKESDTFVDYPGYVG